LLFFFFFFLSFAGLYEHLRAEIPYGVKQRTVGWRDSAAGLEVQQEVLFPKQSQTRMAVGRNGEVVRRIASEAAERLTRALGREVQVTLYMRHCGGAMPETEFDLE
jgi:GTPase Era involved in 16S rRNA processing